MGINLASPSWWINTFVQTFVTVFFIYMLKKIFAKEGQQVEAGELIATLDDEA